METIIVKRRSITPGSPPIVGELEEWKRFDALVAPRMPDAPVEVARTAEIADYDIYVDGDQPTGILSTDVIAVRGEDCGLVGRVNVWPDREGNHVGDQFAVKGVKG